MPATSDLVRAKTAIVTGAGSGIGARLTDRLATSGARVLAADIDADALDARATERRQTDNVESRVLDVRDPGAWDATVAAVTENWGRLDLCFNVAGYLLPGTAHETTPEIVDRHIDVNAKGVIHGTRAAAVVMVEQGAGHIVNIASLAGISPVPGLALYSASKFAVRGFTLSVAGELADSGVAVTVVCPDAVQTPMLDLQLDYPEAALTFSGSKALSPDLVADAILGRVLEKRPIEAVVSIGGRGHIAKVASAFPGITNVLGHRMRDIGLRNQARMRSRGSTNT